ncbi:DUF4397 domain-containing protein [Hymenobacter terrenus]|uniref:DUF4397 domain-containing protein n=1 Tax=Hymenobacter terrenus TaxID=1629124 RepID=UPI0006199FDB|nr:DUF4397 domain-containing protein [Hymenobacter terrenus]
MKTLAQAFLYALPVFAIALSGCDKDDASQPAPARTGAVQVIHAATFNNQDIDAVLEGQPSKKIAYGGRRVIFTTNAKSAGDGQLRLKESATQTDILTLPQTIQKDRIYSLFVYNPTAASVGTLLVDDSNSVLAPPVAGKAIVRLVNLGFEAGSVSLAAQETGAVPLVADVAFGAASPFTDIDAKTYALEVRQPSGAVLASRSITIPATGASTILLRGHKAVDASATSQFTIDVYTF